MCITCRLCAMYVVTCQQSWSRLSTSQCPSHMPMRGKLVKCTVRSFVRSFIRSFVPRLSPSPSHGMTMKASKGLEQGCSVYIVEIGNIKVINYFIFSGLFYLLAEINWVPVCTVQGTRKVTRLFVM